MRTINPIHAVHRLTLGDVIPVLIRYVSAGASCLLVRHLVVLPDVVSQGHTMHPGLDWIDGQPPIPVEIEELIPYAFHEGGELDGQSEPCGSDGNPRGWTIRWSIALPAECWNEEVVDAL